MFLDSVSKLIKRNRQDMLTNVISLSPNSTLDFPIQNFVRVEVDQPWIFTGSTDMEAETPILWPPGAKNWLTGKDPDAGKGWRWEDKGTTEDEMVGWHHWLNGCEFEQAPGVGDGQGSLACFPGIPKTQTWLSNNNKSNNKELFNSRKLPGCKNPSAVSIYYLCRSSLKNHEIRTVSEWLEMALK